MSDVALSLDEIIKNNKNKKKIKNQNAKPVKTTEGTKATAVKTTKGAKAKVKRLRKKGPLKITTTKKNIVTDARSKITQKEKQNIGENIVMDARSKIIQKKKQNMGDARERLGQLAKQGDARDRLNKLKKVKLGVAATRLGLQTGKKNVSVGGVGKAAKNTIGATGLKTQRTNKSVAKAERLNQLQNNPNVTTNQFRVNKNQQGMHAPIQQRQMRTQDVRMQLTSHQPQHVRPEMVWQPRYPEEQVYHQDPPVTYRDPVYVDEWGAPIRQRQVYAEPPMRPVYEEPPMRPVYEEPPMRPMYAEPPMRPMYAEPPMRPAYAEPPMRSAYVEPPMRPAYAEPMRPAYVEPHMRPVYEEDPRSRPAPIRRMPMYEEAPRSRPAPNRRMPVYEEAPRSRPAPNRRMPVYEEAPRSRPAPVRRMPVYEEAPRSRPAPMRKMPGHVQAPKTRPASNLEKRMDQQKPRPQQGHKVMITNLHPCVSKEDMAELLSSVGTVKSSRMITEGAIEAIFLKADDALKCVEEFHNRELDGQAMNVSMIANKTNVQRGSQPKSGFNSARARKRY